MALFSLLALCAVASADMYLQNIRGSNNRLDEANRDRNNANRLFDSQNNNRGGYNVGSMYFYEGEKVPLEWTNQHGCGNEWNDCQIVLQYMCNPNVRDGATTNTIPDQPTNCLNDDCNRDVRFGMHESYDYYTNCRYRYRNRGLFTADQNLNGNTARFTRQNPNGNRRGYECAEERDYYPYWAPTPWVDIAILVDDTASCPYYKAHSENIEGRYFCSLADSWYHRMVGNGGNGNNGFIPANRNQCMELNLPTSPMITFQTQMLSANLAAAAAAARAETMNCNTIIAMANQSGTPFTNDITLAQLNSICPICVAGWVQHPSKDVLCKLCIPQFCASSLVPKNTTRYNITGCAVGMIPDTDNGNPTNCINATCLDQGSTYEAMVAVDKCRADTIAGVSNSMQQPRQTSTPKLLVNSGTKTCIIRPLLASQCTALGVVLAAWIQAPAHNASLRFLDASGPACVQNPWSRPNHLGNGYGGFTNGLNITFPPQYAENCAMRLRYNISTRDYAGLDPMNAGQVNSSLNRQNNDNGNARVDIRSYYGLPMSNSQKPWENARGYNFRNNPTVQVFDYFQKKFWCNAANLSVADDATRCYTTTARTATQAANTGFCPRTHPFIFPPFGAATGAIVACSSTNTSTGAQTPFSTTDGDFTLRLAINTAQFGRAFQDRSHKYAMRRRSDQIAAECGDIYALNVRGKRGNIVQTFPGTEYDYTPNQLNIGVGECIHFQWTGSNTNPNNNDGQGKQGTDRHNIAQQECVRGEGGRGVNRFGGRGAGGTTWTTANLEPGFEGYVVSASPSMGDVQCPATSPVVHKYNWKKCLTTVGCTFSTRNSSIARAADGTTYTAYGDCLTNGATVDLSNPTVCITSTCVVIDRPANPTMWTSGLDPMQPAFAGYNSSQIGVPNDLKHGCWGTSHPEHLDNVTMLGFTRLDLQSLAILSNMQFGGNMKELDDAGTYFDLGVRKVAQVGTYHYMCTRNNNFSNRSQKGQVLVLAGSASSAMITPTGGNIVINTIQTFQPSNMVNTSISSSSGYWLSIPANCVQAVIPVTISTMPSPGNLASASNFVLIQPPTLSCQPRLNPAALVPQEARRAGGIVIVGQVSAAVTITNSSSIEFTISGENLRDFYFAYEAKVAAGTVRQPLYVRFYNAARTISSPILSESFTAQYTLTDSWSNLAVDQILAFERGEMWVELVADSISYVGPATTVPGSLQEITVSMPVSVTLQYGSVYFFPATTQGELCATGKLDSATCSSLRQAVAGAVLGDGVALFTVGGSTTNPAGGYYYVSPGTNLAIVIGVTVACVVVALAAVGSAVYFRKHPDKWVSAKLWGPRNLKAIQRSCATRV